MNNAKHSSPDGHGNAIKELSKEQQDQFQKLLAVLPSHDDLSRMDMKLQTFRKDYNKLLEERSQYLLPVGYEEGLEKPRIDNGIGMKPILKKLPSSQANLMLED